MKRALIVAATGGFLNGFLIPDMKLLQEMEYEVHCAANGNSVSTFVPKERFASIGVTFHQIDFSSTSPVSKESLTAYKCNGVQHVQANSRGRYCYDMCIDETL